MTVAIRARRWLARFQDDHDAAIVLLFESFVSFGRIIETQTMRDHKRRIDLIELNQFEKLFQILMNVRLAHLEGETFRKRSTKRKLVQEGAPSLCRGNTLV